MFVVNKGKMQKPISNKMQLEQTLNPIRDYGGGG